MIFDQQFTVKLALGAAFGLACLVLPYLRVVQNWSEKKFNWLFAACLVLSRVGLFVLIYEIGKRGAEADIGDLHIWTQGILAGHKMYTPHVPSCYSPLYLYVTSLAELIYPSFKSIIVQSTLFELASVYVWVKVGRALFEPAVIRRALLFYLCSPVVIMVSAVSGETQSWVALLLGLACLALLSNRPLLSGLWIGLSIVGVKFLPLLYCPALFVAERRWFRWSLGVAIPVLLVFGGFYLAGFDVLYPVSKLSTEYSSGNLPFLLSGLGLSYGDAFVQRLLSAAGAGVMACLAFWLLWRYWGKASPKPLALIAIVLFQMAMMLVSKKSHTGYLAMCYFPIAFVMSCGSLRLWERGLIALFQVVGSVELGYWFRTMGRCDLSAVASWSIPDGMHLKYGLLLAFQAVVIVYYVWMVARSLCALRVLKVGQEQV